MKGIQDKIVKLSKEEKEAFNLVIDKINKEVPLKGKTTTTTTMVRKLYEIFSELLKESYLSSRFLTFIRDMGLVYLVAEYENFLRNILEITFSKKPEILSTCKKKRNI